MNSWQLRVAKFNREVGYQYPDLGAYDYDGQVLGETAFQGRAAKLREEAQEFTDAVAKHDMVEAIDALVDTAYIIFGTADLLGVDLDPFFYAVHQANMTKPALGARVDPATGIVPKPAGFVPPDIASLWDAMYGDREKAVTVMAMRVDQAAEENPGQDIDLGMLPGR